MKQFFKTICLLSFLSLMLVSCDSEDEEFVDLGLSVKWASCNVGAKAPQKYGKYYPLDDALKLEKDGKRLPSKSEFQELIDNCTWTWTEVKEVKGYKVISKKNGNSIFLPAAGVHYGTGVMSGVGSWADYWSRSVYDRYRSANCLYFGANELGMGYFLRDEGLSVRLVQDVE